MKTELIKDSVEVLKGLRTEMHGKAEDSVIVVLDKVIHDLETAQHENPDKIDHHEVLKMMGFAAELFPAIAEVIKLLSGTK